MMITLRKILFILPCFLLLTAHCFVAIVHAQEPTLDDINEIAKKLNCPTCRGISLSNCPTQTCDQWRTQIGDLLKQGKSEREIMDFFAARYGEQVLQEPPKQGSTLWLWLLPLIALVAGGIWLFYLMRRWKNPQPAENSPFDLSEKKMSVPPSDYLSQVEKDLE